MRLRTRTPLLRYLLCLLGVLCFVCGVLGHLAPLHRFAHSMRCVCRISAHLAPVHWCARSVCLVACAVSSATWLLFTGVHVRCAVCAVSLAAWLPLASVPAPCVRLCVWCPWQLGSRLPVCTLGVLCVRCPWPVNSCSAVCPHRVLCVRSPWPLGSCSAVRPLGVFCSLFGDLDHLAPVHRCARSVCCFACAVSLAISRLFSGVYVSCILCGVLRRVALLIVRTGSALRPASPRALCSFFWVLLWFVFLGLIVIPWHLVLCRGCDRRSASLVCLSPPRWCAAPRPVCLLSVCWWGFSSLWCLPLPGPSFTGPLRGARGGGPGTGLMVPAACPDWGRSNRLAPRRTSAGPMMRLSLVGPCGVGLGLRALRWFCVC